MLYLCFSGDDLFLVISKVKLFITFWGLDSSYIKLICEYKSTKYCCCFIVRSRLCLQLGILFIVCLFQILCSISLFCL